MASSTRAYYLPADMPAPVPHPEIDASFWEATRREELRVQRCKTCGSFQPSEVLCFRCHSFDVGWEQVPGTGTIFSWERVWAPVYPALRDHGPYLVVLVEIDGAQGVRMVGNLVGEVSQKVDIGDRVEAVFEHHETFTLVQWRKIAL